MVLLAKNEGPGQTARMRRLIGGFALRIYPKTRVRMARPIFLALGIILAPRFTHVNRKLRGKHYWFTLIDRVLSKLPGTSIIE